MRTTCERITLFVSLVLVARTDAFTASPTRNRFYLRRQQLSIFRHSSSTSCSNQRNSKRWAEAASEGVSAENEKEGSGQSLTSATCNLVKACVGTGVLTLPWGVAVASDIPKALIPASGQVMSLAALSAYSFFMIGRICNSNGATSLGDAWEKEVGTSSAWVVSAACFSCAFGTAITYSILLGDSFCSLATAAGLKGLWASRQASILAITMSILYPLCGLQSLKSLAPISLVGTAGIFLTCIFMTLRCLPGGPYSLPNGAFLSSVPSQLQPSFGKVGSAQIFSPSALILGSMAAVSYLAHFNAPEFFHALGKRNQLPKFGLMTGFGFAAVGLINIWMMSCGFLTFGGNCSDIVLNNYSHFDVGAGICRLLMALSVIGSYPFMMTAMKSAVLQVSHKDREQSPALGKTVSRSLLAVVTSISLVVRDAGFLVSLNGAIMGSAIIYIIPPVLHRKLTARRIREGAMEKTKRVKLERASSLALIFFGISAAFAGTIVTVVNSYFPHLVIS